MYDRWASPPDHKLGWWWRRWSLTLIGLWSEHALLQYSVMCTAQHNSSQTACAAAMLALITALFEVEHFCYSRSCFKQLRYFIIVDALWKSAAVCHYCWCFWLTGVLWYSLSLMFWTDVFFLVLSCFSLTSSCRAVFSFFVAACWLLLLLLYYMPVWQVGCNFHLIGPECCFVLPGCESIWLSQYLTSGSK